ISRYGRISSSLMNCQIMRVISSPSSSTTGLATLILDTPTIPSSLSRSPAAATLAGRLGHWYHERSYQQADAEHPENRDVEQPPPRRQHACPPFRQDQPGEGGHEQEPCQYQRTAPDQMHALPDYHQGDADAEEHGNVWQLRESQPRPLPRVAPAAAAHLAASGTQARPASPMYSLSGLISLLSACCSITCAVQPAIRLTENTGVKRSVGMPR